MMVAQQKPYTLFIIDDHNPESPREDRDNFGKMICFHKRYSLGDEHDHREPDEFLRSLCTDVIPSNDIIEMVKENKFANLRFVPDENEEEEAYRIKSYCDITKKWYTEATVYTSDFDMDDTVFDTAIQFIARKELLELLDDYIVILPLYLYDHSGVTMNTVGFSCPWDSGQVGWIYATHDDIRKEYGALDTNRAEELLKAEVEEYDHYLTGQCYGFKLYEGDAEKESCWGFLGDISDVSKHIKEYLPSDCKDIVDYLEYQSDIDEDEYLEQTLDYEDEDDMEI